jgi:hypothetical protein
MFLAVRGIQSSTMRQCSTEVHVVDDQPTSSSGSSDAVFATKRRLTALLMAPPLRMVAGTRLQAARVSPRGDADEHLPDHA